MKTAEETDTPAVSFRLLPGGEKTVGRATRADFIIDAALVSRVHCRLISESDGTLQVEDLRSTNGTFVNDRRVKRAVLAPGDRLRVGRVELLVSREARGDTGSGNGEARIAKHE